MPLVKLLQGPEFLKTSAGIVVVTAGAPGADLRAVVVAAVALGASLGPGVPSCTVFPPVQYLSLQSAALRELSKTRQQIGASTSWEPSTGPPVNHADSGKTILKHFRRG